MSLHLRSFEPRPGRSGEGFPFSVPVVRSLRRIALTSPVTFFVGGNGSGKSTLLEAIAAAARLPAAGADDIDRDQTLEQQRRLGQALKLIWTQRATRGFFLRAEDFFGFAKRLARTRDEMVERLASVERDFAGATDYVRGLAAGPARSSLGEMRRLYGDGLDARSHGEAFLKLFESRLRRDGLYLLDEPEAALSPQSQLALIAAMADAIRDGCQFIIASHSPILLAFPGAVLLSFDSVPIEQVAYDQLEHVTLTRDFLNDPVRFLRHIVPEPDRTDS